MGNSLKLGFQDSWQDFTKFHWLPGSLVSRCNPGHRFLRTWNRPFFEVFLSPGKLPRLRWGLGGIQVLSHSFSGAPSMASFPCGVVVMIDFRVTRDTPVFQALLWGQPCSLRCPMTSMLIPLSRGHAPSGRTTVSVSEEELSSRILSISCPQEPMLIISCWAHLAYLNRHSCLLTEEVGYKE